MKTKFWIICLSVFFVSCLRNMHDIYTGEEEEEEEKINKDDFFDFTTVRNSQLIIDYGMKVQTAFYLYDEYPMELVGNTWEFKDINPIYRRLGKVKILRHSQKALQLYSIHKKRPFMFVYFRKLFRLVNNS